MTHVRQFISPENRKRFLSADIDVASSRPSCKKHKINCTTQDVSFNQYMPWDFPKPPSGHLDVTTSLPESAVLARGSTGFSGVGFSRLSSNKNESEGRHTLNKPEKSHIQATEGKEVIPRLISEVSPLKPRLNPGNVAVQIVQSQSKADRKQLALIETTGFRLKPSSPPVSVQRRYTSVQAIPLSKAPYLLESPKLVPILPSWRGPGSNRVLVRPRNCPYKVPVLLAPRPNTWNERSLESVSKVPPSRIPPLLSALYEGAREETNKHEVPGDDAEKEIAYKSLRGTGNQSNDRRLYEPIKLSPQQQLTQGLTSSPPKSLLPVQSTDVHEFPSNSQSLSQSEPLDTKDSVPTSPPAAAPKTRVTKPSRPCSRLNVSRLPFDIDPSPVKARKKPHRLSLSKPVVVAGDSPIKTASNNFNMSLCKTIASLDFTPIDSRHSQPLLSLVRCISDVTISPIKTHYIESKPQPKTQVPPATPMSATSSFFRSLNSPTLNSSPSRRGLIPKSPSFKSKYKSTSQPKCRTLIESAFDVVIYRQEGAARPPAGVSSLVTQLPEASVDMYRRLLTPGHGMGSCSNPHVSWNIPPDPAWYATKRVAPRPHSRKMRKHPYAGARILVYRWALDEMLRKAPKTLGCSERELAYMELGLHRKKAADSIKEIEQVKENLQPRAPVMHISRRLEMDELQLVGLDMVPADELSWGFVVPSRKRHATL